MLSFSFVRHPFERLVSCYNDKVLGNNGTFFRKKFPGWFNGWYRDNHSFPSFVDLILNKYKTVKISNVHWNPISSHCNYCDIEYDVLGRMETFNEDVKYIFLKKNLEKDLSLSQATSSKNSAQSKTEEITKEYFNQLSKQQIDELYEFYRMDFELFAYEVKTYLRNDSLSKGSRIIEK